MTEMNISDLRSPRHDREMGDVSDLVESIREVGLLHPICVDLRGNILGGRRRIKAMKLLGFSTVPVRRIENEKADLAHLDENLARKDLTVAERSKWLAQRKAIYEEMHPETKAGGLPGSAGGGKAKTAESAGFVTDAAAKTGRGERTIREEVFIGEHLTPEAVDVIKGTPIADHKGRLTSIAKLPPKKQTRAAKQAVKQHSKRRGPQSPERFAERLADSLAEEVAKFEAFSRKSHEESEWEEAARWMEAIAAESVRLDLLIGNFVGMLSGFGTPASPNEALEELLVWQKKHHIHAQFAPVFKAIERVVEKRS